MVRFGRGGLAPILAVTSLLACDEMPLAKILSVVEAVSYITVTNDIYKKAKKSVNL